MKTTIKVLLVCIATAVLMLSCSKKNEEAQNPNSLSGTKWATTYADNFMVIEFVSDNQVQGYIAKGDNLAYYGGLSTGSYSVSGNNITFSGFDIVYMSCHYKPQSGSINGSVMQTQGQQSLYSNNDWTSWNRSWTKH